MATELVWKLAQREGSGTRIVVIGKDVSTGTYATGHVHVKRLGATTVWPLHTFQVNAFGALRIAVEDPPYVRDRAEVIVIFRSHVGGRCATYKRRWIMSKG